MKRCVVVAHPDDESLFFGGLVAAQPGDWTIICCSIPRRDPERAWKFFDACSVLGATPRLLPFQESGLSDAPANLHLLDLSAYDGIVTHNAAGEYGHEHHRAIHRHVVARWPDRVMVDGYGAPVQSPPSMRIVLAPMHWERKLAALRCYDHVSPSDGKPKWQALLDRYGSEFDLKVETYAVHVRA